MQQATDVRSQKSFSRRGFGIVRHYAHAVELRMFLLGELSRARSRGIAVPKWLSQRALRSPGSAEGLVNFLRFFRPDDRLRLIDVGANTGYWAADFLRLFPDTLVTAIEPIPSTVLVLRERFAGDSRVAVIGAAVTSQPGPVKMIATRESTLASLHRYASFHSRSDTEGSPVQVDALRLDDLVVPEDGRTLILKLDTQGHEVPALSTGEDLLKRVSLAVIEVSIIEEYVGVPPSFGQCSTLLGKADLHPLIFHDFGTEFSPYPHERDVIFAKRDLLANIIGY